MGEKIWCRDSIIWTNDVGSTDGTLSIDLLSKLRFGESFSEAETPDQSLADFPQVLPEPPSGANFRSDLRAAAEDVGLTPTNLVGARILRTIVNYGLIFSNLAPPVGVDYEAHVAQGWFEGLLVAPFGHKFKVFPPLTLGDPGGKYDSVAIDWLWWSRKYMRNNTMKTFGIASAATSNAVYDGIDTRNGRRFDVPGESLFINISPNGVTPSDPQTGSTINGGCMSWSVLVELPG